jgi:type IV fimbrial biogenesis protein FimT
MQSTASRPYVRSFGFTLIELIITLSIALILISLGIPSFRMLTVKNLQVSELNNMVHHFHLARSLSISKQAYHILCPSNDGERCSDTIDWSRGYILFEDANRNKSRDQNEPVQAAYQLMNDRNINIESTDGRRYVVYQGDGRPTGTNLTLTFCDPDNRIPPKAVIVNNQGRIRVSKTRWDGTPLNCNEEI